MAEHRAFTCDGGCGAHVQLRTAHASLTDEGWYMVFTPRGMPSAQVCSIECLERYSRQQQGNTARLGA